MQTGLEKGRPLRVPSTTSSFEATLQLSLEYLDSCPFYDGLGEQVVNMNHAKRRAAQSCRLATINRIMKLLVVSHLGGEQTPRKAGTSKWEQFK